MLPCQVCSTRESNLSRSASLFAASVFATLVGARRVTSLSMESRTALPALRSVGVVWANAEVARQRSRADARMVSGMGMRQSVTLSRSTATATNCRGDAKDAEKPTRFVVAAVLRELCVSAVNQLRLTREVD